MLDKFHEIKDAYKELHDEFLRHNPILVKYMKDGIWAPSYPKEVFKIFEKLSSKKSNFLDLGSGDGLVVMIASLFFKESYGIEMEEEFFIKSEIMKEKLKLSNVHLIKDDFYNQDISKYDYIFIAPDKEFTLKFENKIEKELNGKLIVYSSIFQPKTLNKVDEFDTNHFSVCIYENKARKVFSS